MRKLLYASTLLSLCFAQDAPGLPALPIKLFQSCPLNSAGSETTLALSVLATLLILIPIVPFVYAISVNALRFTTVLSVLARKEQNAEDES